MEHLLSSEHRYRYQKDLRAMDETRVDERDTEMSIQGISTGKEEGRDIDNVEIARSPYVEQMTTLLLSLL